MQQPTVSVIMTVYNEEAYLQQAIDSVCQQTLTDFELVIVDDGSTDETPQILARAGRDSRLTIFTQPRIGRARALNLAWQQSRGYYVANLDADDQAAPERLEKQVAFLTRHPTVGLLGTACRYRYHGYQPGQTSTLPHPPSQPPTTNTALRAALIRQNPFVHSSVMIPRYILEAVGGYNEQCPVSIDYDLWVRIASQADLACLSEPLTIRLLRRHSYFHRQVSLWARYKQQVRIRWLAWRTLHRPWSELGYVFIKPTLRAGYGWFRQIKVRSKNSADELSAIQGKRGIG